MPQSIPVPFVMNTPTSETALVTTLQVPGSQGPVNLDNPVPALIPQVVIVFFYSFVWASTSGTLTLRCRRGNGVAGAEVAFPAGRPQKTQPAAAANADQMYATWLDTNVPPGMVYTITGIVGTAGITGAAGYVWTNDCG